MHKYTIFTDGAYSPARNQGGIGFVIVEDGKEVFSYSKMYVNSTNQRMELMAVIVALESIKTSSEVIIVTDSMYIVGTLTKNWKRKANTDLWARLDRAIERHKLIDVRWVKGHNGSEYNEKADKLAYNASNELNLNRVIQVIKRRGTCLLTNSIRYRYSLCLQIIGTVQK